MELDAILVPREGAAEADPQPDAPAGQPGGAVNLHHLEQNMVCLPAGEESLESPVNHVVDDGGHAVTLAVRRKNAPEGS